MGLGGKWGGSIIEFITGLNENEFNHTMEQLNFIPCKHVFTKVFTSREDLESTCNEYFKEHMIEGIVVRNFDHSFSAKIMNMDYDSKK